MNNKGFTLIELLMTIAILGLLVAIAVPSYSLVSNTIKKSQRNNKIDNIEIAASKYAYDTGETIIFVDKLITEGYINSDDEDGNIDDPVNNERMNCYIIEMEKKGNYYDAKFIDEKNYDSNGVCDLNKLQESSENVSVQVLNNSEIVTDTSKWMKGNINLNAYSNTLNIDCSSNKCTWTSSSGASIVGEDKVVLDNIFGTLETKYTFQYTIYDDTSNDIKRYTMSVNLKIDNESPVIYQNQITVTDKFIYTEYKDITVYASDGKGSGILGYYVGNDIETCYSTDISFISNSSFRIEENGDYLVCVRDNVGNISSSMVTISYIS